MFSSKKLISIAIISGLMASASAFAADEASNKSATVTFKAQLREAACDITSTSSGETIDFGVFTTETLKSVAANTQIGATKDFSLMLSNCSKAIDPAKVFIYADGQASDYSPEYFANKTSKSLAVQLFHGDAIATGTKILPNTDIQLTSITKLDAGSNASIPLKANLLLTQAGDTASAEVLNVPVTFSVSYN